MSYIKLTRLSFDSFHLPCYVLIKRSFSIRTKNRFCKEAVSGASNRRRANQSKGWDAKLWCLNLKGNGRPAAETYGKDPKS